MEWPAGWCPMQLAQKTIKVIHLTGEISTALPNRVLWSWKAVTRPLKSTRLSSQTGGGTDKREDGRTGSTISPDSAGHQPNAHVHTFDNLTGQLVPCSTGSQSTK